MGMSIIFAAMQQFKSMLQEQRLQQKQMLILPAGGYSQACTTTVMHTFVVARAISRGACDCSGGYHCQALQLCGLPGTAA